MGICALLYGKSGSGKSRSLKNFGENEILHINVEGKELPFRKKFKYTRVTDNVDNIIHNLNEMGKANIVTAVIDDCGYLMTEYFMAHHRERSGDKVYEMYNELADNIFKLVKAIKKLPDNVIVYLVFHEDKTEAGDIGLRTIGKLLDQKVCLEGMVTIVLRCMTVKGKHCFVTKTDGKDITKTPEDMFEEEEIENDLKLVDDTIRKYYEIEVSKND